MAEDQDQESKTEEPTEKRIADAVSKGNVPIAREATLFGSLAAILGVLLLLAHWSVSQIASTLKHWARGLSQVNAHFTRNDVRQRCLA